MIGGGFGSCGVGSSTTSSDRSGGGMGGHLAAPIVLLGNVGSGAKGSITSSSNLIGPDPFQGALCFAVDTGCASFKLGSTK